MRLRELRKERNLRQKDVAQAVGVLTQSYGFYENGINKPDPDTLIRLADFFECSVDYLIGRSDDFGAVQVNTAGAVLTNEEKKLLEAYRQLDLRGKIHLEEYAKLRLEELKSSSSRRA